MSQRLGKKPERSEGSPVSRGSMKLFYNETQDEYEESKIQQDDGLEGSTSRSQQNPTATPQLQPGHHPTPSCQYNSQQQQEDQQSQFSYDQQLQLVQANYQMMRVVTVIQNSYQQFVNIECILQPNILHDVGRLRFILMCYVESMIESSMDDNGEFDFSAYLKLLHDDTSVEHFIYLEYPILGEDYDQQEQVQRYEQMTDQDFEDEFDMLHTHENIQRIAEYVRIQNTFLEQADENMSKNQIIKGVRDSMVGPLDQMLKGGSQFMKAFGEFRRQEKSNYMKQNDFKVQIRKQTNQKDTPIPKSSNQQQNTLKLFNLQPINIHQSNQINTKNLTYQEFVSILQKQKEEQKQKQDIEKGKQKQRKLLEQNKKSQFDQILGRKDDETSKSYLKPFIGQFKKKDSDNQLTDILGLGSTTKKQEREVAELSTPEFKRNVAHLQERIPQLSIHRVQNPGQINHSLGLRNISQNQTQKPSFSNPPLLMNSQRLENTSKVIAPIVGSTPNPFLSNNRSIENRNSQNNRSMSPPTIINSSNQIQRNSIMNNQAQMSSLQRSSQQTPSVLGSLQRSNFSHNQNNFVTPFPNQQFQNTKLSKAENLNSKGPFQNLKNLEQNLSSNIFSKLQTNQNLQNKNQRNPQNTQNQQMKSQFFSNNAPIFINPSIPQNQPQFFQKQQNQSYFHLQPPMSHFDGSNNHFIPQFQQNINQNLIPRTGNLLNHPIPLINGFLGPQKVVNPTLSSLSIPYPQPINHTITDFVPNNVQKMSPQENQITDKTESIKSESKQQKKYHQSSLETKQTSDKPNIYDNSVLQNMKLKDFVEILCRQELRKTYEDLYSELFLLKRWKVINFDIDSALPEKLKYLSQGKTVKSNDLFMRMLQREENKRNKKSKDQIQTEAFCQMEILHKKIVQINEQTLFNPSQFRKNSQLPEYLRDPKITKFEATQRQFSRIEQIQQTLEQKIIQLETALNLDSQKSDNICCEGYLSIHQELSSIGLTLENVEKWILFNGLCSESENIQLGSRKQNSSSLKQERSLIFDGLYQLYSNISRIDSDLEIMGERVQGFKR